MPRLGAPGFGAYLSQMTDNFHSTLVAWLKVVLPLVALGILSTLFLLSRTIDPEGALPYAEVDIAERAREPRLTAPTWAGVTDDGSALTVTAAEARPGDKAADAGARAEAVRAVLQMPGGASADVVAASGQFDAAGKLLTLGGAVVVTSSTGWRVESDLITAALDQTGLQSPGPITATGPAGQLTAGRMVLTPSATRGEFVLVFTGDVRLIYHPPAVSPDAPASPEN